MFLRVLLFFGDFSLDVQVKVVNVQNDTISLVDVSKLAFMDSMRRET